MVFSATSLGLFLYLHLFLLLFIPRVAGSLRTIRSLASDLKSKPPDSGPDFLSTISPGLFLALEIPRNTSLVKVYGRKRTGASLYGICLECSGAFETVNTSLSASEPGPSCLFSLALSRYTDRPLELHNLYDPRFGTYGEISFSFVEYIVDDDATAVPMQICEHHLHWPPHNNVLLRRDDLPTPNSTSTSASTSTSDPPKHELQSQMNTMIGLIAALITITLLIFIVVALYLLFRHRLFRLKQDLEGKGGKLEDFSRPSLRNKSTTLFSTTNPENPEAYSKDKADPLPKDRYITDTQETYLSDPTSSFSTHVDLAQTDNLSRPPQANTMVLTPRRSSSRPGANPPPFDPPTEPVPEVPKIPEPLLIRPMRSKDNMVKPPNGSPLPSVSSHGRTKSQRSQYGIPVQGVGRLGSSTGSNTPESSTRTHVRNQSSSDASSASHEGRLRARPPSKALPPMPIYNPTSSLLFKSTPVQNYRHLTQNGLEQAEARYIELIDGQTRMQTIPESIRSSGLENASPSPIVPTSATQEKFRSSTNTREGVLAQPRNLQEFGPISHPESPELVVDDTLRGRELEHVNPPAPLRRVVRESTVATHLSRTRLSIKIPADPEDWFTPAVITTPLPSSTERRPLPNMKKPQSQGNTSSQHIRRSSDGKVPPLRFSTSRRAESQLPKDQQGTRVREVGLSAKLPVIAPLSPHKRALPKIPT